MLDIYSSPFFYLDIFLRFLNNNTAFILQNFWCFNKSFIFIFVSS
jgi:hypothetical protein